MKILYFAAIRSRLGLAEEEIALPAGVSTVGELLRWQRGRGPAYAEAFRDAQVVRVAVNEEYAGPESRIAAGDEIAFFPPVTGGSAPTPSPLAGEGRGGGSLRQFRQPPSLTLPRKGGGKERWS